MWVLCCFLVVDLFLLTCNQDSITFLWRRCRVHGSCPLSFLPSVFFTCSAYYYIIQWSPTVFWQCYMSCCFGSVLHYLIFEMIHWLWYTQWYTIIHCPPILGNQKNLDKLSCMCVKVVKPMVFPIFLAHNDFIKLVTLLTCWLHLQFVLVVFQFILCPIEMNSK